MLPLDVAKGLLGCLHVHPLSPAAPPEKEHIFLPTEAPEWGSGGSDCSPWVVSPRLPLTVGGGHDVLSGHDRVTRPLLGGPHGSRVGWGLSLKRTGGRKGCGTGAASHKQAKPRGQAAMQGVIASAVGNHAEDSALSGK